MNFLKVVRLVTLALLNVVVHCEEKVNCQNVTFVIDEDHDHVLEGHVFMHLTVGKDTECLAAWKDDCRCQCLYEFLSYWHYK